MCKPSLHLASEAPDGASLKSFTQVGSIAGTDMEHPKHIVTTADTDDGHDDLHTAVKLCKFTGYSSTDPDPTGKALP